MAEDTGIRPGGHCPSRSGVASFPSWPVRQGCTGSSLKNGIFLIVPFFHASSNMAQTPHFFRQTAPLGTARSMKKRGDKKYPIFSGLTCNTTRPAPRTPSPRHHRKCSGLIHPPERPPYPPPHPPHFALAFCIQWCYTTVRLIRLLE